MSLPACRRRPTPSSSTAPAVRSKAALLLAFAVCAGVTSPAWPQVPREQAPSSSASPSPSGSGAVASRPALQSIAAVPAPAGGAALQLELERPPSGVPTGFVQAQPPRVVIDLPGVRNGLGRERLTLEQGLVAGVTIAEAGDRTRLVLTLRQPAQWRARVQGSTVTVELSPPETGSAGPAPAATSATPAAPSPAPARARSATAGPATPAPAYVAAPAPGPSAAPLASESAGAGERISLNFQNIEVRALLQIMAEFTRINIVASDSVAGSLTLRLNNVPWEQALDLILQSRGLGQRRNANVIRVAPLAELNAQDQAELEAQRKLAELEPVRTQAFALNYAKADDVARAITGGQGGGAGAPVPPTGAATGLGAPSREGAAGRLLSPRGSLLAEPRTNQLFVTDIPSRLEQMRALISRVDVPVRQVLIEARIVEADDSFGRALGVKLGFNDLRAPPGVSLGGGNRAAIGSNYASVGSITGQGATAPAFNDGAFVNLPASTGTMGGANAATFALSLFGAGANRFLNLELSALEAEGRGRIVSAPRVITADKVKALIEQGDELPFQVATSSGATSVQFKKASLRLEVVPQITPDGQVILEVDVNKDSPGIETKAGYSINTKHVKTQVLVEDGGTVVIGGIYTESESETTNKVPGLGDVPGLGNLLRNRTRSLRKTELMVFLTPRLVGKSDAAR